MGHRRAVRAAEFGIRRAVAVIPTGTAEPGSAVAAGTRRSPGRHGHHGCGRRSRAVVDESAGIVTGPAVGSRVRKGSCRV
ncbi:hypothetical protein [Streptomyces sp. NPDC002133]|uniref:hypothetical protein n=1 Tax=Streptomyces sp. NPDC002133 TaxID=3154409 RepID=UPI00331D9E9F